MYCLCMYFNFMKTHHYNTIFMMFRLCVYLTIAANLACANFVGRNPQAAQTIKTGVKEQSISYHIDKSSNKPIGVQILTPDASVEKHKTEDDCSSNETCKTHQHHKSAAPNTDLQLVEEGKFWSKHVENLLPEGVTDEFYRDWVRKTSYRPIVFIEKGTLSKCGRDGNAHAIMSDGTQLCVRNSRHGNLGLLGELLAFQLALFMQIRTVPAIAVGKITTNENSTWAGQGSRLEALALTDDMYVTLIQWIPSLTDAHFPSVIQQEPYTLAADNPLLNTLDEPSLVYLAEWTDLVVFDYITGHIDRMTILLDAIRKTGERWLMKTALHNLGRNSVTGELCIFDNECAFFASYPLLTNTRMGGTLTSMYDELLGSVCIFRRSTVDAITKLRQMDDVGGFLYEQLRASDVMAKQMIKEVFKDHIMLSNEISNRIENVFNHMQKCLGKTGD